jgi:hypothetical protein
MRMNDEVRHIRELMEERDRRYQQRFEGQERALSEAKDGIERRLDLLNELREGVASSTEILALEKVVEDLRDRINLRDGKSSGFTAGWGILAGAIMLALAIYAAFRGN